MDHLSESLSSLILIVVELQEQNAVPPPTMPNSASSVVLSASRVVQVAKTLAEGNYATFPTIRNEINEACGPV